MNCSKSAVVGLKKVMKVVYMNKVCCIELFPSALSVSDLYYIM